MLLIAAAVVVSLPLLILSAECLAALWPRRRQMQPVDQQRRFRIDLVIPAHDEASMLGTTLPLVRQHLTDRDRLWVIADNCQDETAEVARKAGARVIQRYSESQRGKIYALDHAVKTIQGDHGDVMVVVDADCVAHPGAIERVACEAVAAGRPVQGKYLMPAPHTSPRDRVSQWAVALKNLVRLSGLRRFGLPSLVTGSGVAYPWKTLERVGLVNDKLAEDTQLSVDLMVAGESPRFCPEAEFTASLPAKRQAATMQRTRWEQGHLQVMLTQTLRLLAAGLRQRRFALLAMAADIAVPPLSLLVLGWSVAMAAAVVAGFLQLGWIPAVILAGSAALAGLTVVLALFRYVPEQMTWKMLLAIPGYVLSKIPIYVTFLFRRQRVWLRTARDPEIERRQLHLATETDDQPEST